jgi:iron complex transport system ATP-binding protein
MDTETGSAPLVELVNATLIRAGAAVLNGVSLAIRRGEHTAILGPNGAGKTSLIRMFTLDDRPIRRDGTPGLRLFGRETWDVEDLRRRLGVVTGDLDTTFGMGTSGGRVAGLDVALSGLFGAQGVFSHHEVTEGMRARARAALERVEALHLAGRPLHQMSTGERRRVLIARALVTDPDALVLDEPTAGLDIVARHRFMESVGRLARHGTTVILVTHHVEEIIPDTRVVVLLRGGRVMFAGPREEALTTARLSELFGAPLVAGRDGEYFHVRLAASQGAWGPAAAGPADAAASGVREGRSS